MATLATVTAFRTMKAEHLTILEAGCLTLEPRDGATIINEGDPADFAYAVIGGDGHVRAGVVGRHSKALMVEVFRTGDIFGEMAVIDGNDRSATAVAEGRVRLAKIRADAFRQALSQSPELGRELCRMMAQRLRRTFQLLQDATFEKLDIRLARQLLYLLEREGRQTDQGVRLGQRVRQGDLADLLGATTRSIITIMNNWRAAGMVNYDTDRAILTIRDVKALQTLVEPPSA